MNKVCLNEITPSGKSLSEFIAEKNAIAIRLLFLNEAEQAKEKADIEKNGL